MDLSVVPTLISKPPKTRHCPCDYRFVIIAPRRLCHNCVLWRQSRHSARRLQAVMDRLMSRTARLVTLVCSNQGRGSDLLANTQAHAPHLQRSAEVEEGPRRQGGGRIEGERIGD